MRTKTNDDGYSTDCTKKSVRIQIAGKKKTKLRV